MPDVRNCKSCGKIFNYAGGLPVCSECRKKEEENFKLVRDYLYKNPGASMSQISSDLQISAKKITEYLKDGRLEIVGGDESNIVLQCEGCGKSINTGRLCDTCSKELTRDLQRASAEMTPLPTAQNDSNKYGTGMRYLNKDKNKK